MTFDSRLGCSTISFRRLDLPAALTTIAELGFTETELGSLPGVCDHVPLDLDPTSIDIVADQVARSGLAVRSINADVGDLNLPLDEFGRRGRDEHLRRLAQLARRVGAEAVVLPCGAQSHDVIRTLDDDLDLVAEQLIRAASITAEYGVRVWVESLHYFRLCWNTALAEALTGRLANTRVGVVMDFSHIVASGGDPVVFVDAFADRIAHVHIRDAVDGDINLSVGNGDADFAAGLAALRAAHYPGHVSLELETADVADTDRPAAAAAAGRYIESLL